ncbi:hypothetical protein HID58_058891 [Brassica napus]|uniref:Uncharacterized protein n=1 Tax=Brassica napus TaxID=3708 RepID=A0ABQ7ZRC2_BRANA|nr:hypothetical protein HID58_058891 [Brassica napus]
MEKRTLFCRSGLGFLNTIRTCVTPTWHIRRLCKLSSDGGGLSDKGSSTSSQRHPQVRRSDFSPSHQQSRINQGSLWNSS